MSKTKLSIVKLKHEWLNIVYRSLTGSRITNMTDSSRSS